MNTRPLTAIPNQADDANAFERRIRDNLMMNKVRQIRGSGHYPYYKPQTPVSLNEVELDGRVLLQLGSSNYLGLAQDPRVQEAVIAAMKENGSSCTSSRLLSGTRPLHIELEEQLAQFFGKDAAIVFATGYLANIGTIPALVGRHDLVVYDAEVHACLIDGMRLSGADGIKFAHNDCNDLESKLAAHHGARKLILIDSIYSLNGDLAPLDRMVEIAQRHGAWIFLDDAHGGGVLGPGGRGLAALHGLQDEVQIIMGVFSKALASTGGFVAGSRELVDYLHFGARSYLYSNAIAPAQAAAALASLRILMQEPERAHRAVTNATHARSLLRQQGWRCGGDDSHMVSVLLGDDALTLRVASALIERGVWVGPAISPGVPAGKALLRTNFPPTLSDAQMAHAMDAFAQVGRAIPEALRGAVA